MEVQVLETELRLILLPGKRKSNENAASASLKKRVVFKEYQWSGLRQAFQGTNGHASPELTEKLAETLDLEAKQVKTNEFYNSMYNHFLKKGVFSLFYHILLMIILSITILFNYNYAIAFYAGRYDLIV